PKLLLGHRSSDGGYPAGSPARMHERIHHRAVVGAVTGGLHDDIPREAESVAQSVELLLRRVAWRVLALRRIGKLRAGSEHMAVCVYAFCGQLELRLRRDRAPVQPAGGFLECRIAHAGSMPCRRFVASTSGDAK